MAKTDEELMIKVAEILGWSRKLNYIGVQSLMWRRPDGLRTLSIPPNYPKDLNATHDMEEMLAKGKINVHKLGYFSPEAAWMQYTKHLQSLVRAEWNNIFLHCHATARQRCEAFILTMESK